MHLGRSFGRGDVLQDWQMRKVKGRKRSRRDVLHLAVTMAAVGPFLAFPDRARAAEKTLKIAKWAHFLPEYDGWFETALAREWGRQNDTNVIVDHIPAEKVHAVAAAEVATRRGHDVFIFPWPPAEFQRHVIDHSDVYQTVAMKYGQIDRFAHRSTFNRKSKTYFAFADSCIPTPLHYFEDYWGEDALPLGPLHFG